MLIVRSKPTHRGAGMQKSKIRAQQGKTDSIQNCERFSVTDGQTSLPNDRTPWVRWKLYLVRDCQRTAHKWWTWIQIIFHKIRPRSPIDWFYSMKLKFYYWCYDTVFGGDHWAGSHCHFKFHCVCVCLFHFFGHVFPSMWSNVLGDGQWAGSHIDRANSTNNRLVVYKGCPVWNTSTEQTIRPQPNWQTPMHFARIRNLWGMFAWWKCDTDTALWTQIYMFS